MSLFRILLSAAVAAGLLGAPALADPRRDADRAFDAMRQGRSMPLPEIQRRVTPLVPPNADYLGPEFNGDTYRFKYIENGKVIWIDVDAATGRVKGRSH
ncbi:MAG TPA: hypothetical protein VFT61_04925 [Sphingomicrobium sp.]|jgi:hypothetical protein|nr:hypothetical protein [Sphingomicrobium sp.]